MATLVRVGKMWINLDNVTHTVEGEDMDYSIDKPTLAPVLRVYLTVVLDQRFGDESSPQCYITIWGAEREQFLNYLK